MKRLTEEEFEWAYREYKSGKSTYQIAEDLGCVASTLSNNFKKRGWPMRHGASRLWRPRVPDHELEHIVGLRAQGFKNAQIAQMMGWSPSTVSHRLREARLRGITDETLPAQVRIPPEMVPEFITARPSEESLKWLAEKVKRAQIGPPKPRRART